MPAATLHTTVLDDLGTRITAGEIRPGDVIRLDEVQERYNVSSSKDRKSVV